MGTDEAMESELGLGELAGLTVANEADSLGYDVSRKRLNELKSHCTIILQKTVSGVIETWKIAIPPSSSNLQQMTTSHHLLKTWHLCLKTAIFIDVSLKAA